MADVTTSFFANASQAEAAIAKLEQKYADLENRIRNVSRTSKQQSDFPAQMGAWATQLGSVAAAYTGVSSLISQAYQNQIQLNEAADAGVRRYDELIRKLRVQGSLTQAQGEQAQTRLVAIASGTATGFDTAQAGSEEMISQGFSAGDATGGGLKRILETMKNTNARDADVKPIVAAYSALLAATGQDKNQENLDNVTRIIQRTFKDTPLQAPDLQALAPKIQGVASAVPFEEAIAQFAVIKGKTGKADTAATTLKMFWEKLQTASSNTNAVASLAEMGITPEQVDAIGETPTVVLDRMAAGLEKLAPEKRQVAMKNLFGEEAMSGATGLIRDRAQIAEFMKGQQNEAGFQEDLRIATRGSAAAKMRADLEKEQQILRRDSNPEELMRAAELLNREAGVSETVLGIHRMQANVRLLAGQDPLQAVASSFIDPAEMEKSALMRSGATLPPELLQAKVAELRGQIPGGVSAQEFLAIAAEGKTGAAATQAQQDALAALAGEEGAPGKAAQLQEQILKATQEQTEVLRKFLEQNARKPARNAGGGE